MTSSLADVDRTEILSRFPHPVLVVTSGVDARPSLASWGGAQRDDISSVSLQYGDGFDEVALLLATDAWTAGDRVRSHLLEHALGAMWEQARSERPERPR
jgi:hypothetical protein